MTTINLARLMMLGFLLLTAPARADPYTVLVLGDSISAAYGLTEKEGWVHLAGERMRADGLDVDIVNASISGDTSIGGLRRLPDALERFDPNLLVIELGGNDGLRGYSPKALKNNLRDMANLAKGHGADVLILGMLIPSNYGDAYVTLFSEAFTSAAEESGASLLPFLLEPIAQDRDYFQSDGIHPTADAQPLLVEHVLSELTGFVAIEATAQ